MRADIRIPIRMKHIHIDRIQCIQSDEISLEPLRYRGEQIFRGVSLGINVLFSPCRYTQIMNIISILAVRIEYAGEQGRQMRSHTVSTKRNVVNKH